MNPTLTRPMNPAAPAAPAAQVNPVAVGARRRWPLLAIGASAGTAVWSGWVGLGELTGFGVVRPLPGIADSFAINTAVTLPIGVEAYAMYALSIATSNRALPVRTRRYAWASSAAALLLGMAGQVAYHVMTADQPSEQQAEQLAGSAPWWVIALVSCLPVLVLGAASLLWHLAGQTEHPDHPDPDQLVSEQPDRGGSLPRKYEPGPEFRPATSPESRPATSPESRPATSPAAHLEPSPGPGPKSGPAPSPTPQGRAAPDAGLAPAARPVLARENDVARVRAAIAAGHLPARPTVEAIREHLSIGRAYARAARTEITHTEITRTARGRALTTTPEDSTAPATADPATSQTPSVNGHAFTARSTRTEESTEPEADDPEHMTEALFTDHSTQPFNNSTSALNPLST